MTINDMKAQILSEFLEISEKTSRMNEKIDEMLPYLDDYSQKLWIMAMMATNEGFKKWLEFYEEGKELTYKFL